MTWWTTRPPVAGTDVFFGRDVPLLATGDLLALRRFLALRLARVHPRERVRRWRWQWLEARLHAIEAELARRGQARHPKAERRG